jgi:hypothetical protein
VVLYAGNKVEVRPRTARVRRQGGSRAAAANSLPP